MDDKQIFENWELFKDLLKKTNRENINNLIKWLDESDFKFAPASTKYHNSFRGGLLKHSLDVYYAMKDFKNFIKFFDLPQESVIITSLLHDICKVNCYNVETRNVKNADGEWVQVPYYTWYEQEPIGHGAKSVMLINEYGVQLTKIERAMIVNHMGFSNGEDTSRVNRLFSMCPQSLILHWADEACTFIKESPDLQDRFRKAFKGTNIEDSLHINEQMQSIVIDNMTYKLAPQDSVVDGKEIIELDYNNNGVIRRVKVYAPYKDGLPF